MIYTSIFGCLLISWVLQICSACQAAAPDKAPKADEDDPSMWSGWPKPEGMPDFETWLKEFHRMQKAMQKANGEYGLDRPADAGPNWPSEWGAIGPGMYGAPPPPMAYEPSNSGKPAFCYDPPTKGPCEELMIRWGYNPMTDDCVAYNYSGCLGTQNNFKTRERCLQECIGASQGGCDTDTGITMDELLKN